MDFIAFFELLGAAEADGVTLGDVITLGGLYANIKAGKFDLKALAKSAAFQTDADSVARASAALSKILRDPDKGPKARALIGSIE